MIHGEFTVDLGKETAVCSPGTGRTVRTGYLPDT